MPGNPARRSVDFYEASVFLWYDVDAEIRERTGGKASLDDFGEAFTRARAARRR